MFKSWMPTLGGLLSAVGVIFTNSATDPTLHMVGEVLSAVGVAFIGITAKQFNATGGSIPTTPEAKQRIEGNGK